jgi:hypothetical protein
VPQLPTVQLNEQAPRRQLPDVGVPGSAYVGRGLDSLADTFVKIQDGADAAEKIKLQGQATSGFQALIQKHQLETTDPEEYKAALAEAIPNLYNETLSQASNPRVRKAVEASLADNYANAQRASELGYFKKKQDKGNADALESRAQLIESAKTATGDNINGIYQMYGDLLGNLRANNYIDQEMLAKEAKKFPHDVQEARAGAMLFSNPRLFKATVETEEGKKQFSALSGAELYSWGQKASELIKEREQEGVAAEKARVEKVNKDMLLSITKPGASLVAERESVRRQVMEGKISAKDGEHWIDNIDRMIKEQQKPEKEKKEADPFKTSDSATLARVMSGVINNPEQWDSEKITAMMGNGLSVPHALRAVAMLDKANKDPAGTLTPMKQAQQTWNRLQSDFAFVPVEERQRGNPEAITKNSREAQRIFDQVQNRADRGEDPRVVLEELMQPHYDEKIKGWFDTLRSGPLNPFGMAFGVPPSREEGIKARQELLRRGLMVTDEAVKSTVEVLRRAKQPVTGGKTEY